jgi:hypothetical protein
VYEFFVYNSVKIKKYFLLFCKMYHSKAKSKSNISLQEAILNLSNNNYTSRNIA